MARRSKALQKAQKKYFASEKGKLAVAKSMKKYWDKKYLELLGTNSEDGCLSTQQEGNLPANAVKELPNSQLAQRIDRRANSKE